MIVAKSQKQESVVEVMDGKELSGNMNLDRREILKTGLLGLLLASLPILPAGDSFASKGRQPWEISFRHGHTGESFSGVYRIGDRYMPDAFERLNYVMRDFRTGEVFPMDPRVIDILSIIQRRSGVTQPMEVLSGYRSPKTNAMLRRASTGVAKNSFHMYGQAIDFRLPHHNTRDLRNIARDLKAGGVGYYPKSDFVHIDTGKVRSW